MGKEHELQDGIVELSAKDGIAFIEQASPLTRLHYFDGKFLRADAFAIEQDYHRQRTRLANLAGGWGVVNGLGIGLAGNRLQVGAGLAITAAGNFVLATADLAADLADLIQVAAAAPLSGNSEFGDCLEGRKGGVRETGGLNIYEITVGPVEGLCGNEAVFGKLCESACVSSSQHPYWREGVVLRLRPINLALPGSSAVALGNTHLRNRVASAYFAAEPWLTPSAVNSAGLASELWCNPASLYGRDEVVIGLLVRDAGINRVIDAWSGRRERMDTQARGYWQGRMAMRPWNVFVAQILQFQCQLAGVFDGTGGVIKPADDCEDLRQLLDKTRKDIESLHRKYSEGTQKILRQFGEKALKKDALSLADQVRLSYAELYDISETLNKVEVGKGSLPQQRMLLRAGFVELPPAGYLPVVVGKQPLEDQLARIFGEGVRLHYHSVRADEIAHLVEEAQHMERISLTRGLDDASRIEEVEIFVPDGEVFAVQAAAPGEWWQVEMSFAAISAFRLGLSTQELAGSFEAKTLDEQAVTGLAEKEVEIRKAKAEPAAAFAPAGAGIAAPALDAETLQAITKELQQLFRELLQQSLFGLARTESRDDGSHGFTLVATLDTDEIVARMRAILEKYPELDKEGKFAKMIDGFSGVSLYLGGDISRAARALANGERARLSGELGMGGKILDFTGELTMLHQRPLPDGRVERVAGLRLLHANADGSVNQATGQVSLLHDGDGDNGEFILDDSKHDPATSPTFFEWRDTPRTATMSVLADTTKESVTVRMMASMTGSGIKAGEAETAPAVAVAGDDAVAVAARKQLLRMNGLSGMPGLDTAIGAAALGALIRIADAADDPAFLARARRRLFPTIDTPAGEGVRAVRDWVMFRRARSHLCCPKLPTPVVKPAVEAFQVWHLAVADAAALKLLRDALDRNDTKQLATYKFQQVGVLRYRDENTVAEESEARIEAMWRQARPGPQVVLGRHWERQPSTGQGWQNHFRLRSMLEQISEITAPPARGDGALAALSAVSPPLADGAMDGGLLVVTMAARVELKPSRVVLMRQSQVNDYTAAFKTDPAGAWKQLKAVMSRDPTQLEDMLLDFTAGNQLTADSATKLGEACTRQFGNAAVGDGGANLKAIRIDAAQIDASIDPAQRHRIVLELAGKTAGVRVATDAGAFAPGDSEVGQGAQTATIVFYEALIG